MTEDERVKHAMEEMAQMIEKACEDAYRKGLVAMRSAAASVAWLRAKELERGGKMHEENSGSRDRLFARSREASEIEAAILAIPTIEREKEES